MELVHKSAQWDGIRKDEACKQQLVVSSWFQTWRTALPAASTLEPKHVRATVLF